MHTVQVKNIIINKGIPKICVPFIGKTREEIEEELKESQKHNIDIIEWRIDCFEHFYNEEEVLDIMKKIYRGINEKVLLVTFRTLQEGGAAEIDQNDYVKLYETLISSRCVDMIDLEFSIDRNLLERLIQTAHKANVKVVISHHNFQTTLPNDIVKKKLVDMQKMDADIAKIAVMPHSRSDVLNFMNTIYEVQQTQMNCPIVGIAMGEVGEISRICGEYYKSAITFASMKNQSAPGQIFVDELFSLMTKLHTYIG